MLAPVRAADNHSAARFPEVRTRYSLAPLVGRRSDLFALGELMGNPAVRLLTITGPTGVGKSRLAAEFFSEVSPSYAGGSHYVDLADVPADADIAEAVLSALGSSDVSSDQERPLAASLVKHLGSRECLLLLDHGEQLADQTAALLPMLLGECPCVRVIVVLHEPLRIYGECLFRVAPLELPPLDAGPDLAALERVASVEFFLQRARAARAGFALTSDNYALVSRLCCQLDGLPLAIEFAARQLKLNSIRQILANLDDGSDSLSGKSTDTLARHHSMRAAVEWSYAWLTENERLFMSRAAIFGGGFRMCDAQAVVLGFSSSCLEFLEALVDKNMLLLREEADGELSFSMLATVRAYALDELRHSGHLDDLLRLHAAHLRKVAVSAEPRFYGPDRAQLIARLTILREDLPAAFRYLAGCGQARQAAELAASLVPYWFATGRVSEGTALLEEAVELDIDHPELLAKVMLAAGQIAAWSGHPAAHDRLGIALKLYTELGDLAATGQCLHQLAVFGDSTGSGEAEPLYERAASALGEVAGTAGHRSLLVDLAESQLVRGQLAEAGKLAEQVAMLADRTADAYHVARAYRILASVAAGEGDDERAAGLCRHAIRLLYRTRDFPALAAALEALSAILVNMPRTGGSWARSTRLLAAAHATYDRIGYRPMRLLTTHPDQLYERARIRLGDEAYDANRSAGRSMSADAAVTEALASPPRFDDQDHAASAAPLTPREFEVAELVGCGLTNREISRRLGIAEWTVVNHLRKIMRKLECPSRVHVANWVAHRRDVKNTPAAPAGVPA